MSRTSKRLVLPRAFLRMCQRNRFGRKIADSTGVELSGNGLLIKTLVFRRLLRREVLAPDERFVGLLLPPSAAGLLANAALTLDRRVAVNLNYTLTSRALNECVKQAGIRHVLTSRRLIERLGLEVDAELVYLEDFKSRVTLRDKILSAIEGFIAPIWLLERMLGLTSIKPDDLLTVIFTSGSTGVPKGVMLSFDNVGSNVEAIDELASFRPDEVFLGVLPFFHAFGYTCTVWAVLTMDVGAVYHVNPLEADKIAELSRKYAVTFMIGTPTFLRTYMKRCHRSDFPALDIVIAGAEKLSPALADAFEAKLGVRPCEGYGTTELSPLACSNVPPHRSRDPARFGMKEGTVGRPIPNVQAKVVDPDTFEERPRGQSGLLLFSGPNVMQGYYQRPDLTAAVLRDGWYVTGDMASIDEDGFVTIRGRETRFSKIGGEMVPHLAVEEAIAKTLGLDDDEAQVVVCGIPDEQRGERLIVLHKPMNLSPEQVCRKLAEQGMARLWIPSPDSFVEVDSFPVLGTGKLDLQAVNELARARFARHVASA